MTTPPILTEQRFVSWVDGLHMIFTMLLGVMFALIAPSLPRALPLWVWGMIYGALIWVIDILGALQAVNPTMAALMNMGLFFITHLVYGGVLGWWVGRRA